MFCIFLNIFCLLRVVLAYFIKQLLTFIFNFLYFLVIGLFCIFDGALILLAEFIEVLFFD